nr:putative beta-lysine N-acetyltransferase [uncultured Bacillus sp.]
MPQQAYSTIISNEHYHVELYIDRYNKRVRVDDYRGNIMKIIEKAEETAKQIQAEKLIVIARMEHFIFLIQHGFVCEAMVESFFRGSDAYFAAKYYHEQRHQSDQWVKEDAIIRSIGALSRSSVTINVSQEYDLIKIKKADAESLADLYKSVFKIYPVPLHDPDYIRKTIDQGTIYYAYRTEGTIVSVASAEVNARYYNAEMTDCATLPDHRQSGLMKQLLMKLESAVMKQGIFCMYSIARAQSFGMNAVLHQLGYQYRGRLLNNCLIYEKLENMNMWVKALS